MKKLLHFVLVPCLLALSLLSIAPSAFAASHAVRGGNVICHVVISRLHTGERASHVVSRQCSAPGQQLAAPKDSWLLLATWTAPYYTGTEQEYFGTDGPCDNVGYGIADVGVIMRNAIESFQGYNNCGYQRGYRQINYQDCIASFVGGAISLRDNANNQINSFWIGAAFGLC